MNFLLFIIKKTQNAVQSAAHFDIIFNENYTEYFRDDSTLSMGNS